MPRMKAASVPPQPEPSGLITVLGTVRARSVTLVSPMAVICWPVTALIASGVCCSLVSRNWAVTTTSPTVLEDAAAGASAAKAAAPALSVAASAAEASSACSRMDFVCLETMRPFPLCGVAEAAGGSDLYAGPQVRTLPNADKQQARAMRPSDSDVPERGGRKAASGPSEALSQHIPSAPKSIES